MNNQNDFIFTVKRYRGSVTQGVAQIYLNNELIVEFEDNIELIKNNEKYYGENIGGWASTISDEQFLYGLLFNPRCEIHRDKIKQILNNKIKEKF